MEAETERQRQGGAGEGPGAPAQVLHGGWPALAGWAKPGAAGTANGIWGRLGPPGPGLALGNLERVWKVSRGRPGRAGQVGVYPGQGDKEPLSPPALRAAAWSSVEALTPV